MPRVNPRLPAQGKKKPCLAQKRIKTYRPPPPPNGGGGEKKPCLAQKRMKS